MRLEQLELTGGGTLTLYLRESVEAMPHFRQRPLVLVVPGGGYNHVSPREGDPVALQFAAAGYHTAVLHYAVGESARDALPMRQLAQAIGLVRRHAEQWNILPDKIALCGFSAGGHLALSGAVWDIPGMADQPRPNALLLLGALHKAGVPCEAHLFEKGCHGTSISTPEVDADSAHRHHWVQLAVEWLNRTFCFNA